MEGSPEGSNVDRAALQAERDRNRTFLRDLHARSNQRDNQAEEVRQKIAAYDAEMNRMRVEFSNMQGKLEREKQELQGKAQRAMDDASNTKRQFEDLRTQFQRLQQEWTGTKSESTDHKRKLAEQDKHIRDLKQQAKSPDVIQSAHAKAVMAQNGVESLRRELEQKGVFAQKREEPEDASQPSVGTMELGEDVFSARLLLRLGYLRKELQDSRKGDSDEEDMEQRGRLAREFRRSEGSGSDSEEGNFSMVGGLWEPEIEEDAPGYCSITVGWMCICVSTLAVQVLVLLVLLFAGMGSSCLKPEYAYPSIQWWLLHVSKFIAMFTAGVLLGKDLMDCLNYWLVSALLEPTTSCEVVITAIVRFAVNILIVVVQAYMYAELADAGTVWLSMSALGFIGGLNGQVLDIAKSGAFGHHIAKTMTSMNYQLDFLSTYPGWFFYARGLVICFSSVFVLGSSAYTFVVQEEMCES